MVDFSGINHIVAKQITTTAKKKKKKVTQIQSILSKLAFTFSLKQFEFW